MNEFLSNSVEFKKLGLDLDILRNNLERSYADFIKRLISLGYGNVRPDGEITIEAPRLR